MLRDREQHRRHDGRGDGDRERTRVAAGAGARRRGECHVGDDFHAAEPAHPRPRQRHHPSCAVRSVGDADPRRTKCVRYDTFCIAVYIAVFSHKKSPVVTRLFEIFNDLNH